MNIKPNKSRMKTICGGTDFLDFNHRDEKFLANQAHVRLVLFSLNRTSPRKIIGWTSLISFLNLTDGRQRFRRNNQQRLQPEQFLCTQCP